ncbi:MAG: hypothetical protein Q7R95_05715 [bacterium]|nr:hypothetical protein [bacterium]
MNKKITTLIAQIISLLFGPIIIPLLLIIILFNSGLKNQQIFYLLPITLILLIGIPYGYIVYAIKNKSISDIDITKREQRFGVMLITIISAFISLISVYFLGNQLSFYLYLLIFIILVVNSLITLFWKISLHMTANIIMAIIINFLLHWQYPILFITIPLIFWSRLYLKKHTFMQLLVALILNGGIAMLFLSRI